MVVEDDSTKTIISNTTGKTIVMTKSGHSVLEAVLPLQAGILPMPTKVIFMIDGNSISEYEWKFFVNYDGRQSSQMVTQISRQLWVSFIH